jgi:hypothetical protein
MRFKPKREVRLLRWETALNKEVAQRKDPELPMPCDMQNLGTGPRVVAEGLLSFGNQTCALLRCFGGSDVEGAGCFGEVGDEEITKECDGEGDDAAYDEEPLV